MHVMCLTLVLAWVDLVTNVSSDIRHMRTLKSIHYI